MCDSESECWKGRLDEYSEGYLVMNMPCYTTCKKLKLGKDGFPPVFAQLPPPFSEKIDAWAWNTFDWLQYRKERTDYFFSGDQVITYTLWPWERQDRRVQMQAMKISEHPVWKDLPAPFNQKIDAISWNGGRFKDMRYYIFSGDQVIEYTLWDNYHKKTRVMRRPCKIAEHELFKDLPPPFNQKIDAITQSGVRGRTRIEWIVSGDQVVEYLMYSPPRAGGGRLHSPPSSIVANPVFDELPPPFSQKIDAFGWNGNQGQLRIDYIYSGGHVLEYKLGEFALKKTALQNGKRLQGEAVKLGALPIVSKAGNQNAVTVVPMEHMERD